MASNRHIIRAKTIAIIRRDQSILVEEVIDGGVLKGYRPLGGSIEFGEKSWEALEREFMEELGEDIKITDLAYVDENIFTFEGQSGHEVIFVYEAEFLNKSVYSEDIIERMDVANEGKMTKAIWVDPNNMPEGKELYPNNLPVRLKKK